MADAILRQATCVAIDGRAVLIEGAPGSGKSSLALALIDRGAELIGDDGVSLWADSDRLVAGPPPRLVGAIEIRNVGIVTLPVAPPCRVAMLLTLDPAAPRYVETAGTTHILGIAIPSLALWPDSPHLALRAEWALRLHGLGSVAPTGQKDAR